MKWARKETRRERALHWTAFTPRFFARECGACHMLFKHEEGYKKHDFRYEDPFWRVFRCGECATREGLAGELK